MRRTIIALAAPSLSACCSCGAPSSPAPTAPEPALAIAAAPTYEVHEWGLVRGTSLDQVMLSGPHRDEIPMPMAKPVLYFHREGEGPLAIDVEVAIPNGSFVEHWPLVAGASAGAPLAWRGVELVPGNCAGSRYPSETQPPCDTIRMPDACEALTLATVETSDGDCVRYGGEPYDHLFYRGEIAGAPDLPLRIAREGSGVRVTLEGFAPIPGSVLRIRRSSHAVSVVPAPAPGASALLPEPSAAAASAADALVASLREAGLTDPEVAAFRRAWDNALFGGEVASAAAGEAPALTTIPPLASASPMAGGLVLPTSDDAILYVLPLATADALAPLTFTPHRVSFAGPSSRGSTSMRAALHGPDELYPARLSTMMRGPCPTSSR